MKNQKLMVLFTALALAAAQSIPTARAETTGALTSNTQTNQPIPWSEVGAKATSQYSGEGLTVFTDPRGAVRLRCAFQRLEGEVTDQGLWLTSSVESQGTDRFRVVADYVGRNGGAMVALTEHGEPACDAGMARFDRRGLREEYLVSVDGVRQDFVVLERPTARPPSPPDAGGRRGLGRGGLGFSGAPLSPALSPLVPHGERETTRVRSVPVSGDGAAAGEGGLRVELAVSGAKVQPLAQGAQLVLGRSRRELAYSRLRVTDANGKELSAQLEVVSDSRLAVVVDDAGATYPVRIDPTFSDANWVSMGVVDGADGEVWAAVVDGSGNLYIGGDFRSVAGVSANAIAKWNGSEWSALGSGIGDDPYLPTISALAVSGSDLYVGGTFSTAGEVAATNIAKWNGNSWSALGEGLLAYPSAMAVSGTDLYVGGSYTTDSTGSGDYFSGVAKWNGNSWSVLSIGSWRPDHLVLAVAVSGNTVYAGGAFTSAGGVAATNIAKWDGNAWSAMGPGLGAELDGEVRVLAMMGTNLYAGGSFTFTGQMGRNRIARWNGSEWDSVGAGLVGPVQALAVSGTNLYAGGWFDTAGGGVSANGVAKWNGSSWSALGSGTDSRGTVFALAATGNDVYVGGAFATGAGVPAINIAKWNGTLWSALGSGGDHPASVNGIVYALAVPGSDLYVGGAFLSAGGVAANCVAKWNGNTWSALGSGMELPGKPFYGMSVTALAVMGNDLYAGGFFDVAGGVTVNGIASWNGSSWSALGSGLGGSDPYPEALAVSGTNLYVGGRFTSAGGLPANHVAKWNGSSWSAVGTGTDGWVTALAISGNNLYAGGSYDFNTAGGVPAKRIAKWDGISWSGLETQTWGDNSFVSALATLGSELYVGGYGMNPDSSSAVGILRWNTSNGWSALGSGVDGHVQALAVSGSDLYVAGAFTTAAGVAATNIARWNGSAWSALGSGLGGNGYPPSALAVSGSDLYVGGGFSTAGGKVSANIARAYLVAPPGGIADSITASPGTANLKFYGNPGHQFDVLRATNLAPPVVWTKQNVSSLTPAADGVFTFTDTTATNGMAFYRSVEK